MRESVKEFVQIVAETLPILEPVYEFGALQVPSQLGFADLRPIFSGKEYIGCDMMEGPGVDRVLNLHNINLPLETAGTLLILDTLEHVEFVRKATEEAYRILKPNGILIISSVMKFHIHDYPHDYWRFTPEAFKSLLRPFNSCLVDFAGDEDFPHTVVGIGFKGLIDKNHIDDFMGKIIVWKKKWYEPTGKLWRRCLRLITPPLFLELYKSFKRKRSKSNVISPNTKKAWPC